MNFQSSMKKKSIRRQKVEMEYDAIGEFTYTYSGTSAFVKPDLTGYNPVGI